MKVDIKVLLTTLTGGCPVVLKNDEKELEKLYRENAKLNLNLPLYEEKGLTKEELRAKNIEVKSEAIFEQVPELVDMKGTIDVAGAALYELISNGKSGSKEYLSICNIVETRAKALVGKDHVNLKFQNEIEL